jgi:hypothetical protein
MIRKALTMTACVAALTLAAPQSFGEPTNERSHTAAGDTASSMCGISVRTHQLQEFGGVAQQEQTAAGLPSEAQTTNPVPFPATPHQKQVLHGSQQMDVVTAAPGEPENTKLVNGMPATEHQKQFLRSTQTASRGVSSPERNIGGC